MKTYFICNASTIKIGKSENPTKRLKQLQTANSERLYLIAVIEGDFESELHSRFSRSRLYGEWFDAGDEELIEYINEISDKHVFFDMQKEEIFIYKKMKR